jgi:hypothetical protein
MNFRPKLLKVISSVVVGIILTLIPFETNPPSNSLFKNSIFGLIFLIIVYLIWSLFQDKK